jgi:D-alanyl-D-alanine carboxypeptidase/D-alanyl-D-alanine-endopeptidase (penicillin-binding protein 4)
MELLGPTYRYQTILGYDGVVADHVLKGNLYFTGSGDPSLGSWRFDSTKEENVLNRWLQALKRNGIQKIEGSLVGYTGKWESAILPGGWIWDDIGNYYGAGSSALSWHENQYDLILRSGNSIGDKVIITGTKPKLYRVQLESQLVSAAKGTGDNAYIYLPPTSQRGFVSGTIPVNEKAFVISGSFPDPALQLVATVAAKFDSAKIKIPRFSVSSAKVQPVYTAIIDEYHSPSLDSLNYWFMKKSINLYGEAFIKTIAYERTGFGSADKGLELVKEFWKQQGIEPSALRIIDGSGLSPQNRVTVDALVKVLQYAKSRPWFSYYYDALPVYNQMKLKSGTIGGAKSFAGYHTAKDGTAYTVAVIINNYAGSAGEIVRKMFLVLDELK